MQLRKFYCKGLNLQKCPCSRGVMYVKSFAAPIYTLNAQIILSPEVFLLLQTFQGVVGAPSPARLVDNTSVIIPMTYG